MENNEPIFNSGIAFVEQISKLLWTCNQASIENNYVLWYKTLRMLFNNTSYFLKEEDREEIRSMLNSINMPEMEVFKTKKATLDYMRSSDNLLILDEVIRFKLHEKGLIMPKGADVTKAMRD